MEITGILKKVIKNEERKSMLERLACNQGRNDEELNIQLAQELCEQENHEGIAELADRLETGRQIEVNDCIKVQKEYQSVSISS